MPSILISAQKIIATRWLAAAALPVVVALLVCFSTKNSEETLPAFGTGSLSWVPPSAQTVTMVRGPIRFGKCNDWMEGKSLLQILQCRSAGPLSWGEDWFHEAADGQTLLMALEIEMNFTKKAPYLNPSFLQFETPYDSAHVLVFSKDDQSSWDKFVRAMRSHATEYSKNGEFTMMRITYDQRTNALGDFFIFSPRPGVLMYATDRSILNELIDKMTPATLAKAMSSANPIFGREKWFGIRRYRTQDIDGSSPLHKQTCWSDDKALGFAMRYKDGDKIEWTYYSEHPERAASFMVVRDFVVQSENKKTHSRIQLLLAAMKKRRYPAIFCISAAAA